MTDQIQNNAVGVSDSAGTIAAPVEGLQNSLAIRHRLFTEGGTQVDQNIEELTGRVNAANAALMDLAINETETMEQIEARLESSRETDSRSLAILHKAQAAQTSYHAETLSKEGQAINFQAVEGRRAQNETKQAYETAVAGEVEIVSRKHRISREAALKLVEADIAVRGISAVLPVFSRVRNRYLGQPATAPEPALPAPRELTAVEIAEQNLARAQAAAETIAATA